MAGYAVECALKACIAKRTQAHDFPPKPQFVRDLYQHDIESLANLAGLRSELRRRQQSVVHLTSSGGAVGSGGLPLGSAAYYAAGVGTSPLAMP